MYPACAALKRALPDSELHLLGLRMGIGEWARNDPLWKGVHLFDPTRRRGAIVSALGILWAIRRQRFDASLAFFPTNKAGYNLFPFLANVKDRCGFAYGLRKRSSFGFLLTRRHPVNPSLHDMGQNMALAGMLLPDGLPPGKPEFPKLFGPAEARWADEYLALNAATEFRIGIHPGSSAEHGMDAKRWDTFRFAALADWLCEHTHGTALIFGGSDEVSLKQAVATAMRQPSVIVDPIPLRKTAALLKHCSVCICNDSGLMHAAACMDVPTIGIFGPTDEKRNGPIGAKTLVVRKHMPGFPLWTAATVGDRSVPHGMNPRASLDALTAQDAWEMIFPWLKSVSIL
jgi:ADP-heptose:LPS heptosyltransferase